MNNLKIRKILIVIIFLILIAATILKIFAERNFLDYQQKTYDNAITNSYTKTKEPETSNPWVTGLFPLILLGIFWLFGFIYTFVKRYSDKSSKKWPYINLILFSILVIGILIRVSLRNHYTITKNSAGGSNPVLEARYKQWFDNGYSLYKNSWIIVPILFVIILLLSITQLFLIIKDNNNEDSTYSEKVKATAEAIKIKFTKSFKDKT